MPLDASPSTAGYSSRSATNAVARADPLQGRPWPCSGARPGDHGPAPLEAGDACRRAFVGHDDETVDLQVGRPGQPLRHRVGTAHHPALRHSAAAASISSSLPRGSRSHAPRLGQHGSHAGPPGRSGLRHGRLHQLVATGGAERQLRPASVLQGLVGQVDPHDVASRDRAIRMRCISMLPEATVAETE